MTNALKSLALVGLLSLCAASARASEIAPLCEPLSDPLATTRACVVAATFPSANMGLCFDVVGKPPICTGLTDRLAVSEAGTFELNGVTYAGAPAGAAFVAAARIELPHGSVVSARGTRHTATAIAADRFRYPPEPSVEAPTAFTPTIPTPSE